MNKQNPPVYGASPSSRQLAWHAMEFYGFIHFTTNTFTGKEWGYGDESPNVFNPTALDARQWAKLASEIGMKGLILTCKHHDGFCLWPSRFTEHSVKNSPWKNGKGDVVREVSEACREFGLKFGVYLSPWDRNRSDYGRPEYITYFRNQLRELLTQYGPVFEVWFDGANGGDGYYGGARESRMIDRSTYYDWPDTIAMIRELQPEAICWSDAGPDARWIGNERGIASETNWNTFNLKGRYPGYSPPGYNFELDLGVGHEDGDSWVPAEVDVSIRPGWFYHASEDSKVKTPARLLELYYQSIGRGATLLLNLPPDQRGLIHETDVANLRAFRSAIDTIFKLDLAMSTCVSASNVRGNLKEYSPDNLIDGCPDTFWATDDGITRATVEWTFPTPIHFNHLVLQELIELGQRIRQWHLEIYDGQSWQKVCEGSTIGYKRILSFSTVQTSQLRLVIDQAKASPVLSNVSFYNAPVILQDPKILRDRKGNVTIQAGRDVKIRYTLDGTTPNATSSVFEKAFALPRGGIVRAAVLSGDNPGSFSIGGVSAIDHRFGLAKDSWRVMNVDDEDPEFPASNAIDDNSETIWHTDYKNRKPDHPHTLDIDLGQEVTITALGYLPRQDGIPSGVVDRSKVYLTLNPDDWGKAVAESRYDNIASNPIEQIISLSNPVRARYLRFVTLSTATHDPWASVAEINVYVD
jgi:alpha-L-fucosidase